MGNVVVLLGKAQMCRGFSFFSSFICFLEEKRSETIVHRVSVCICISTTYSSKLIYHLMNT